MSITVAHISVTCLLFVLGMRLKPHTNSPHIKPLPPHVFRLCPQPKTQAIKGSHLPSLGLMKADLLSADFSARYGFILSRFNPTPTTHITTTTTS